MINDQNRTFGRIAAGYDPRPAPKKSKNLGDMLIDNLKVEYSKPFAVLNMLKATKYKHIYPKSRIKIVSCTENV